jgi:hypothetical protein
MRSDWSARKFGIRQRLAMAAWDSCAFSRGSIPGKSLGGHEFEHRVADIGRVVITAFGAFVITWVVAFTGRTLNAAVTLFRAEKDRADVVQVDKQC